MTFLGRVETPYTFIQRYTEYESRLLIELFTQTALSTELLREKIESEIKGVDLEEQYGNPILEEYENLKSTVPIYLNRIHFVLLFTLFEKTFFELITKAEQEGGSKIHIRDLQGRGIEKYFKYAHLVLDIELTSVEKEWVFIKNCQKLRNIFVHNYGEFDPQKVDAKELKSLIAFFKGKVVVEYEEIKIMDKTFNLSFHENYLKFILHIVKELDLRFAASNGRLPQPAQI